MTDQTKNMARRLRMAIPLLAIAVGVFLLVGCIYVPIPEHGTNWSRKISALFWKRATSHRRSASEASRVRN